MQASNSLQRGVTIRYRTRGIYRRNGRFTARARRSVSTLLTTALLAIGTAALPVHADVTTVSQDAYRTGWDQNEAGLSPGSVTSSDFGQQFSTTVDGQIYAQPLIVNGSLIVTTENDKVYGMDPGTGAINWTDNFGPAWPASTVNCGDLVPNIGSTSTPVYDPASGYVYLTTKVNDGADATVPHWYMHAVNPATGAEKTGFPVVIDGYASNDPNVPFNAEHQQQRPGLLLMGGVVYAAFGSHCDGGPYRGWVVGISTGGTKTAMWDSEVNWAGSGAGIWQSGGGIVSDGPGRIFVSTGNGVSPSAGPGTSPPPYLSESVVRLQVQADGSLKAADFFSPSDAATLDANDKDLASGGPMALPDSFGTASHPHLLVQQGKDGRVFLLDRDSLGGMAQGTGGTDAVVGVTGPYPGQWGHPAFWGGDGGYAYVIDNGAPLRALKYGVTGGGSPALSSAGTSTEAFQYTSGSPVVTSNGTTSGSAVVWAVYSSGPTGSGGILRAYNAVPDGTGNLTLLGAWPIGTASKFPTPATNAGRVYVGTRDGKVLAFGRPSTSVLTGASVDLGKTNVGSTASGVLTVTATKAVTISAISTAAPFGVTPPALPTSLASGASLSIPVSFSPTAAGSTSGMVTVTTDSGTINFSLTGTGTKAGLGANPASVNFTNQPTGLSNTVNVQVTNTGTGTETISGSTAPSTPYTVSGLPAAGSTLAAGASFIASVTYKPTTAGTDTGSVTVTSTSGTLTIPINGTAVTGSAKIVLAPATLDFGSVPIGTPSTQSFTITNSGNIPATITLAKAPANDFTAASPLPEGLVIGPGKTVTQAVTFTPSVAGAQTNSYQITSDSGQGAMQEPLQGTGVTTLTNPPVNWQVNGSATNAATGAIQLTPATNNVAGSAFYTTAVPTTGLSASFTAQLNGGTGGDGSTLALVDSTKGTTTGVGAIGGGMGFSGLPGVAIVLGTSWAGALGYGNYVAIAQSPAGGGQNLTYLASAKVPTPLGTGTHPVSVTVNGGVITVTVDGTQMLKYTAAAGVIPAKAYVGFTASTGSLNDVHTVSGLTIMPGSSTPVGAALTATPTSVAFGNVTVGAKSSQNVVLQNNGGLTETVTAVTPPAAPFTATLPAVNTTVAPGASVTVPVTFAPTVSGNASSSIAVTTTSGTVTVPISGLGVSAASGTLPAFSDASWSHNGTASISGTTATLTTDGVTNSVGDMVNSTPVNPLGLTASFSATISGTATQGADGMTFALFDASTATSKSLGGAGGGLGVSGIPAVFVSLDTYGTMGIYGSNNWCAVGTSTASAMTAVASNTSIPTLRNATNTIKITVTTASHIVVTINGTQVLDAAVTLPGKTLVAFTAGSGSLTDTHTAASPTITYSP
jgi:Abnormal spindle-like microcephaly-assoc'd, ASPM-SPD-2-Hydin